MRRKILMAGLAGAALLAAAPALGQAEAFQPGSGEALLARFDQNLDGKITDAEMDRVLNAEFDGATKGGTLMTEAQFTSVHVPAFRKQAARMFRQLDWNGDGRLTLAEYAVPEHAAFEARDPAASGTVACAPEDPDDPSGADPFCVLNDPAHSGKVTRASFDALVAKRFAAAAGGASTMTLAQFLAEGERRLAAADAKLFVQYDTNHDGVLTRAEYMAPDEALFAQLDRNGDRVLTEDELEPGSAPEEDADAGPPPGDTDAGDDYSYDAPYAPAFAAAILFAGFAGWNGGHHHHYRQTVPAHAGWGGQAHPHGAWHGHASHGERTSGGGHSHH